VGQGDDEGIAYENPQENSEKPAEQRAGCSLLNLLLAITFIKVYT
jgi:hypothetical protein